MKRKIMILACVCVMLSGCGAKSPAATESVGIAAEEGSQDTETVEGTDTMEEADPEGTIRTTAEDLKKLPPEIQEIFFGSGEFYDVEEKKTFTKGSFRLTDSDNGLSTTMLWNEFLVADVDQDEEYELGVYMEREDDNVSMDNEVRIFDLSKGTVYAHPHRFRGVKEVYENGVLVGSSGAADNRFYRISYDGKEQTENVEAYSTLGSNGIIHYYISDEEVTEEEFYDDIGKKYGMGDKHVEITQILWSNEYIRDVIK